MFKEDPLCQRFLADEEAQNGVSNTRLLSEDSHFPARGFLSSLYWGTLQIKASDYDAIF